MGNETVLITGASYGIGRELAELFAADGARLVLTARSKERLDALARQLRNRYGTDVAVSAMDLAQPDAAAALGEQLARQETCIDILVNNAGFGRRGRFAEMPLRNQLDMIQVNLTALTHLTGLYLPEMLRRNRGGILNVASVAAFQPGPNMAVYFATKAYVLHFSEALAEETDGTNVSITCLAPGPTHSEFAGRADVAGTRMFRSGVMDAKSVAVAGHRGFRRGKSLVIPGLRNRLGTIAVRFAPRALVRKAVEFFTEVRNNGQN